MNSMFLFAYGSLRNARSRQLTLGNKQIQTFDAVLDGSLSNYMLDFCYRCDKWKMSCLGLHVAHIDVVDKKERKKFFPNVQGTILRVDQNMLDLLDKREVGYKRRKLDWNHVDVERRAADLYVYIVVNPKFPNSAYPIKQAYLKNIKKQEIPEIAKDRLSRGPPSNFLIVLSSFHPVPEQS